ncbi:MAG: hypothetical protein ACPG19_05090 [Saprospiraceae bacterium]
MRTLTIVTFLMTFFFVGCQQEEENILIDLMQQNSDKFGGIMKNKDKYEVQIIYTQINRDEIKTPHFTSYTYNVDSSRYFYPSDFVALPTAAMSLEKLILLHQRSSHGTPPDYKYYNLQTGVAREPQTAATTDSTAENNLPSVAQYTKKMFLTGDKNAYNRLYEFLGQNYLNTQFSNKKQNQSRVLHRLDADEFDYEANKYSNPYQLFDGDKMVFEQKEVYGLGPNQINLGSTLKGKAFVKADGTLVNQPFDFSKKNFISAKDMEKMVKISVFPEYTESNDGFYLTEEDYFFLQKNMSLLPRESTFPTYDEKEYPDSYNKYLMFGGSQERIPDHIRIFNKVGKGYGYLVDCAYIVDLKNKVEFMLTAVIYTNENDTFNDGKYEYESIGLPFMANLGQVIYDYELKREREFEPEVYKFEKLHE